MHENMRAELWLIVKRILRKYGYPPDNQEKEQRGRILLHDILVWYQLSSLGRETRPLPPASFQTNLGITTSCFCVRTRIGRIGRSHKTIQAA